MSAKNIIDILNRIIVFSYLFLFALLPLIFLPYTSEMFELNKTTLIYLTAIITGGCEITKFFILKQSFFKTNDGGFLNGNPKTILIISIFLFYFSQIISTIKSVDPITSVFGYYSRFHGGLLSTSAYLLLFFVYLKNFNRKNTYRALNALCYPAIIVCGYALIQKIGLDKDFWTINSKSRVFSSLGQPNWLAAYLVTISPIFWLKATNYQKTKASGRNMKLPTLKFKFNHLLNNFLNDFQNHSRPSNRNFWIICSAWLLITIIFSGSRSGLLGFFAALGIWLLINKHLKLRSRLLSPESINGKFIFRKPSNFHHYFRLIFSAQTKIKTPSKMIFFLTAAGFIFLITNTAYNYYFQRQNNQNPKTIVPASETKGTESGRIRILVWQAAVNIWQAYPLTGSGVETFAYVFPKYKPLIHNQTSEWDYIYNKAHNEYLNVLATTGTIGALTYLFQFITIIYLFFSSIRSGYESQKHLSAALFAGFAGMAVTNFFGFSTTTVGWLFYLYPAIVLTASKNPQKQTVPDFRSNTKVIVFIFSSLTLLALTAAGYFWQADYYYNRALNYNRQKEYSKAADIILKAIQRNPFQPIYPITLAQSLSGKAGNLKEASESKEALGLAYYAYAWADRAVNISPANPNLIRNRAGLAAILGEIDIFFLDKAEADFKNVLNFSPSDPKIYYHLGLISFRKGNLQTARKYLLSAIDFKSTYQPAREALAMLFLKLGEKQMAIDQYRYILTFIDPDNANALRQIKILENKKPPPL